MKKRIEKVSVIGCGTMGAAIAQHLCMKGLSVVLVDTTNEFLERGLNNIKNSLIEAVERKIITNEKFSEIMAKLKTTTNYKDLADCDLVIEAVFENFEVKQKVFANIEEFVRKDCIIASNTSSFSITDLGSKLHSQDRFVGVHYFYHAAKNKLVEIIPGAKSNAELIKRLENFYNYYDKSPIIVKDVQGFAVNRFFVPWLNEGARLFSEGVGSMGLIDQVAMEVFQVGMGPFALMNATGVPIAMHAAKTLEDTFGKFYAPADILVKQVSTGKNWEINSVIEDAARDLKTIIKERLLAASLGVAAQMVSEEVASTSATDLGARLGLRWPMGPIEMINFFGITEMKRIIGSLFSKYNLEMPKILAELRVGENLPLRFVNHLILGDTGIVEFNRPDSMNALNEITVQQLSESFNLLEKNEKIKRIVFAGLGKAFVAGADIKFFVDNINKNKIENIYKFTEYGQNLFKQIASSQKSTYTFIHGLALGGGLELALCTKYRIATAKTVVGFPETGIGIYPGLGGTQRSTRLIGKGLAKYLVATGNMVNAKLALDYGLVNMIIEKPWSYEELIDSLGSVSETGPKNHFEEEAFADFSGELSDSAFENAAIKKYEKVLKRKAPLALKKSMEMMDQGAKMNLDDALFQEMNSLNWIFKTQDALVGLQSVLKRTRPEFIGL